MSKQNRLKFELSRGFTLIELLVVVALLAVIMLAMSGMLKTAAQVDSRVLDRQRRMDDLRQINLFLRQIVKHVSGRRVISLQSPSGDAILFHAQPHSLQWVGVMPARHGAGGRAFFRLAMETDDENHKTLVLRHKSWSVSDSTFPDWSSTDKVVLVSQLKSFQVRAEGRPPRDVATLPQWPDGWQLGWSAASFLPDRVELQIQTNAAEWPPLVIPIQESGLMLGGSTTAQVGGS